MKFDCIIGNPPYNGGMYIDFVRKGFEYSNNYSLWITPANWGSREDAYKMRRDIKTHLKEVVWFVESDEIFDNVKSWGGILYYLIDNKNEYRTFPCKTVCSKFKQYEGVYNEDSRLETFHWCYIGNKILKKLGDYKPLKLKNNVDDEYFLHCPNTYNSPGGCLGSIKDPSLFILSEPEINTNKENLNDNDIIIYSGTKEECLYFKSYLMTKFIRYFLFLGMNILHPFTKTIDSETNKSTLRYVPEPDSFDHNLSEDDIYIINKLIKERIYNQ